MFAWPLEQFIHSANKARWMRAILVHVIWAAYVCESVQSSLSECQVLTPTSQQVKFTVQFQTYSSRFTCWQWQFNGSAIADPSLATKWPLALAALGLHSDIWNWAGKKEGKHSTMRPGTALSLSLSLPAQHEYDL